MGDFQPCAEVRETLSPKYVESSHNRCYPFVLSGEVLNALPILRTWSLEKACVHINILKLRVVQLSAGPLSCEVT